jgi:mannose-1-phosphate guanylyltransferase/mannose-6-phosphate isomerase
MISVIIAGGSGTRLWPLSTPDYPKHLLQVNGDNRTLVQNAYDRVADISSKVFIIPDASHAHHVKEQLPELSDDCFIVEPARRGTASCVLAALVKIAKINPDEPIAFVAADHYIRDVEGFKRSFKVAQALSKKEGLIVEIGIEPEFPSTGFGYIEKGELVDEDLFAFKVKMFKEKPDYQTAKKYVKSGNFLWNCNYFFGSVNTFLHTMEMYAPKMRADYEVLLEAKNEAEFKKVYLGLDNIAIDYALMEHIKDQLLIPATFDWMDLGSYADLHKATESDDQGNHATGDVEIADVQNSFIQNHEDKPMAVIGLDNIAVINTKDGILITRKDLSQAVGDVAKKIHKRK